MNDLPLIKRIVSTNKPLIISTGMASLKEISDVYLKAKEYGAKNILAILCNYPSKFGFQF